MRKVYQCRKCINNFQPDNIFEKYFYLFFAFRPAALSGGAEMQPEFAISAPAG